MYSAKRMVSFFSAFLLFINVLTGCANINQMNGITGQPYRSSYQAQKLVYSLPDKNVWNPRPQPIRAVAPGGPLSSPFYTQNGYFPYNESPKNWTKSITEEFSAYKYLNSPEAIRNTPPIQFALEDKKNWSKDCQTKDWKITQQTNTSVIYSTYLVNCDMTNLSKDMSARVAKSMPVYIATKVLQGTSGRYIITYTELSSSGSPAVERQVLNMLKNARLEPASAAGSSPS